MLKYLLCILIFVSCTLSENNEIDDKFELDNLINSLFVTPQPGVDFILPTNENVMLELKEEIDDGKIVFENTTRTCSGGICLPIFRCSDSNSTNDHPHIDIRIDIDEHNDCHYLEKCCPENNILNISTIFFNNSMTQKGCGHRHTEGIGYRITELDDESQYGEFPWMTAILKENSLEDTERKTYQCGGALIHPRVVLTAAHCVWGFSPIQLRIRVGEWDTQTVNELLPHQHRDVAEIIIHNGYRKTYLTNDIGLLILSESVELAENVQTICLPPENMNFNGNRCTVSGWGKDHFGKNNTNQVILRKLELPIIAHEECAEQFKSTRLGHHFSLHDSFICAGGEFQKDVCKGDGGSPLVCSIPGSVNRYYQAGIVSWGLGCNMGQIPVAYVNVSKFREWIDLIFHTKGLQTSYYTP